MSYCMNFYLNWHRNCTWSKLKVCFLLSKYQSSSYDHVQFLCQLRQKFIQQLILKLLSIVKRDAKGQRMLAFLRSKTALCKRAIQYIKPALSEQKFSALQNSISRQPCGSSLFTAELWPQSWSDDIYTLTRLSPSKPARQSERNWQQQ